MNKCMHCGKDIENALYCSGCSSFFLKKPIRTKLRGESRVQLKNTTQENPEIATEISYDEYEMALSLRKKRRGNTESSESHLSVVPDQNNAEIVNNVTHEEIKKSRPLVILLSMFFVGGGQAYNGQPIVQALMLTLFFCGFFVFFPILNLLILVFSFAQAFSTAEKINNQELINKPASLIGIFLSAIVTGVMVYLFFNPSIIDKIKNMI